MKHRIYSKTFLSFIFLISMSQCMQNEQIKTLKDSLKGSKDWSVSISYPDSILLTKKLKSYGEQWVYSDDTKHFAIEADLDTEGRADGMEISQMEYCKMNLKRRKQNFPFEHPCGDRFYQEIVEINGLPFVFTESYCTKSSQIQYECCTVLDKEEFKLVLSFGEVIKKEADVPMYRERAKSILNTLRIYEIPR